MFLQLDLKSDKRPDFVALLTMQLDPGNHGSSSVDSGIAMILLFKQGTQVLLKEGQDRSGLDLASHNR